MEEALKMLPWPNNSPESRRRSSTTSSGHCLETLSPCLV